MWHKRQNRKKGKYLKYLGILFLLLGASLILTAAFILLSPYVISNPLISPLPINSKTNKTDIKSLLEKQKISISSFSVATDSSYLVSLSDGGIVIFSASKDLTEQARSLQIILSRLTIEGKKFKSLDFRFDKPVVSF